MIEGVVTKLPLGVFDLEIFDMVVQKKALLMKVTFENLDVSAF